MHSISIQFYKYLINKLIIDLKDRGISKGERFYLRLDEIDKVSQIYEIFKQNEQVKEFIYRDMQTCKIAIGEVDLVIATTADGTTPHFMVTLRNECAEQNGVWKDTALLVLCDKAEDSIIEGSRNLQSKEMPFHIDQIVHNVEDEINQSALNNIDKEILKKVLEKKQKDVMIQYSIWDYEEIFGMLHKKQIEQKDYNELGLFYDSELANVPLVEAKNRIKINQEIFDKIDIVHNYDNPNEKLQKQFDEQWAKKLAKEDWKKYTFEEVKEAEESYKRQNKKKLTYVEQPNKMTEEGCSYWEKAKSSTNTGERSRHIIVFNTARKANLTLQFEFLDRLKSEFIQTKSKDYLQTSGKKLKAVLEHIPGDTSYYRLKYAHEGRANSTYEFNIAIVEWPEEYLEGIKKDYLVTPKGIEITNSENIVIGNRQKESREHIIQEDEKEIEQNLAEESLNLIFNIEDEEMNKIAFILKYDYSKCRFIVKEVGNQTLPYNIQKVWNEKRLHRESFKWEPQSNRIHNSVQQVAIHGSIREFLEWESEWIEKNMCYAEKKGEKIKGKELRLNSRLKEKYYDFLNALKECKDLPTLAYYDGEMKSYCERYIEAYNRAIEEIRQDSILTEEQRNISKLGILEIEDVIYLTPFHPLNIAYQLEIYHQLETESVENYILKRLNRDNLLPFIYGEKHNVYRAITDSKIKEWIGFKKAEEVSIGSTNQYLAKIIEDKIQQFMNHFKYLFLSGAKAPLKINLINIINDKEAVRGIIRYVINKASKSNQQEILPIEAVIYYNNQQEEESYFEKLSLCNEVEEFNKLFEVELEGYSRDALDMLKLIQSTICYYKLEDTGDYKFAHISFYKMHAQQNYATNKSYNIEAGIGMKGLMNTLPAVFTVSDYRTGFGTELIEDKNQSLVRTAINSNELFSNMYNSGANPYQKESCVVGRTSLIDQQRIQAIYEQSNWVTFIDPCVSLDYFKQIGKNLLVIHYSDQYGSISQYNAITVTTKINQYEEAIKYTLGQFDIEAEKQDILKVIDYFTGINGEWILKLLKSKGFFAKEKFSLITAIKHMMCVLHHEEIVWIPISLEEILRIAGIGLSKLEGAFSVKNLGVSGEHCDDLMFMGVEENKGNLYVHFYPVEVKCGQNDTNVIKKARQQAKKTASLFHEELGGELSFASSFHRYFFIQVLLITVERLKGSEFCTEEEYHKIKRYKEKLLNDNYEIATHLADYIGEGAVMSFKSEGIGRYADIEEDILLLKAKEQDAYQGVVKETSYIEKQIYECKENLNQILLRNQYTGEMLRNEEVKKIGQNEEDIDIEVFVEDEVATTEVLQKPVVLQDLQDEVIEARDGLEKEDVLIDTVEEKNNYLPLDKIRLLIGTIESTSEKVYWEFGHKELANRHLLISGKSGQGKSYFIQCLLVELAKQGISSVIIDYTDGFKQSALEPKFKEALQESGIKQEYVCQGGFPINPFKRNQKELDEGFFIQESDIDIAERVKSVFKSIYRDIRSQQEATLYNAILMGLEKYGDKMNLDLLVKELEDDSSDAALKLRNKIRPLVDRKPFSYDREYNWDDIFDGSGQVLVIQLTAMTRDVQLLITEFILWDLWNYKVSHGKKDKPFPVILDEAQNLDHKEYSPSAKILTEGRKFGWSGWYATQFLQGQLEKDEIMRLQNTSEKIYFAPPESEVSAIANNLSHTPQEKQYWEKRLINLKKGQCIVHGPVKNSNEGLDAGNIVIVNITQLEERL